jgi:hypothetical protein
MRKMVLAVVVAAACLVVPGSALAWSGGQIVSVSCPEIHVKLPVVTGAQPLWKVLATDEAGRKLVDVNVAGSPTYQVVGGLWTVDNATHQVTVTIGNAANIQDGKVTQTVQLTNCAAPAGVAGPPGPPGPPGVGYDCAGKAVATGGTPALCPGTPGTPGTTTTIIIRRAPRVCTSKRVYSFRVRRTFALQRIVSVRASEPGVVVHVTRHNGRFVVRWSTRGKQYTQGGIVRTVTVRARLENGRRVRLQWQYRPCMGRDGEMNDPSAAGQGSVPGTASAAPATATATPISLAG